MAFARWCLGVLGLVLALGAGHGAELPQEEDPFAIQPDGPIRPDEGRRNLIIAPIGDNSQHELSWLESGACRSFDLLALYYGSSPDFKCEACVATYRLVGPKWHLLHLLSMTDGWAEIVKRYERFMFADDDLIASTYALNLAFARHDQLGLRMSQLSVCDHPDSYTFQTLAYRQRDLALRYVAFVEIMAPLWDRATLEDVVLPTLDRAHVGHGLDHVWPLLLGLPRDRIAILDEACMFHPAVQASKQSTYSAKHPRGWTNQQEREDALKRYNVTRQSLAEGGIEGFDEGQRNHVWSRVPLAQAPPVPSDAICWRGGATVLDGVRAWPTVAALDPAAAGPAAGHLPSPATTDPPLPAAGSAVLRPSTLFGRRGASTGGPAADAAPAGDSPGSSAILSGSYRAALLAAAALVAALALAAARRRSRAPSRAPYVERLPAHACGVVASVRAVNRSRPPQKL